MNTPICSFLDKYASDDNLRLHMPGHKGIGGLSERYDLTEISGADSLYEASGIIKESEENASLLFGSRTFYSTEGSSLAIRAMLYLALLTKTDNDRPLIIAGRNAHKVFISAAALLDLDIEWITGKDYSYLCTTVSADALSQKLKSMPKKPLAVYLTSPDYLGNVSEISEIANVCHNSGVLLLIDNAHGAYLAFTNPSMHPIKLGADMCADSAHKTLPCLTGAAYLHLSNSIPENIAARAKSALSLFGSTSPSYLILASLDKANAYLADGYTDKLVALESRLASMRKHLEQFGYKTVGNEPMKLTIAPKSYGYTGYELYNILSDNNIISEFCDPDFLVLMPTPQIGSEDLDRLEKILTSLPRREQIDELPPPMTLPQRILTPREAVLSDSETVDVSEAHGRVLADITVGCPPAVPIVVSGEKIDESAIRAFKYYGITKCSVIKK